MPVVMGIVIQQAAMLCPSLSEILRAADVDLAVRSASDAVNP